MKKHYVPNAYCPKCLEKLDGASGVNDNNAPKPRDASVCIYCAAILCFTEKLSLREMTEEELKALPVKNKEAILKALCLVGAINDAKASKRSEGEEG